MKTHSKRCMAWVHGAGHRGVAVRFLSEPQPARARTPVRAARTGDIRARGATGNLAGRRTVPPSDAGAGAESGTVPSCAPPRSDAGGPSTTLTLGRERVRAAALRSRSTERHRRVFDGHRRDRGGEGTPASFTTTRALSIAGARLPLQAGVRRRAPYPEGRDRRDMNSTDGSEASHMHTRATSLATAATSGGL